MEKVSLTDFISETLISISDGVRRAQEHSKKNDGVPIAPNSVDGERLNHGDQLVKFLVTVEVGNAQGKKGTGEVGGPLLSIAIVTGKISGEATSEKKNASHQTIEFSVPMHFHQRWMPADSQSSGSQDE